MMNAISDTRIREFRAFIESETASRRKDNERYISRSIDDFKVLETLFKTVKQDESAWSTFLSEGASAQHMRFLVDRLHLADLQSVVNWVVRTEEIGKSLIMKYHGSKSFISLLDDNGRRHGTIGLLGAMIVFINGCPEFPLTSELWELLRIVHPRTVAPVFRMLLRSISTEGRGSPKHAEGERASKTVDTESTSNSADTPLTAGDIYALTARAEDLKNALECAQIQIESYEREIAALRADMEDDVRLDIMSQMNSPAFGMLLDQFAAADETISRLRRDGFNIPKELESVAACVRLFMRAMRSFGVMPVSEVGAALNIDLEQSEEFDYSGTEFENADDIITIRIVSPGWKYKDTVFSRPRAVSAS